MNGAERRFSYRDLKLNFKILLIYFIVLAVFIMFSFWLYNDYTLNITKDKVREYSEQVLTVQESSIENTISSLNNISRMIIANGQLLSRQFKPWFHSCHCGGGNKDRDRLSGITEVEIRGYF